MQVKKKGKLVGFDGVARSYRNTYIKLYEPKKIV